MRVKVLRIIKSAQREELISSVNYENVDIIFLQHTVCRRYGNFFLLCSVYKLWISPINNEK
jgi:hypothetical protein